ncbi:putative neuroblastoma-amplified sequence [Paratrimastix pyriformis]|uniref:Neuroblastoma-amplified sequence n=1 Tax=Paratrimastix pyriformis TaxID=342808 RepID=A0ABQ8UM75_9EUKA|nr:putative neuroblastoma-amplified sequence [Paratrimastix pyriformis]
MVLYEVAPTASHSDVPEEERGGKEMIIRLPVQQVRRNIFHRLFWWLFELIGFFLGLLEPLFQALQGRRTGWPAPLARREDRPLVGVSASHGGTHRAFLVQGHLRQAFTADNDRSTVRERKPSPSQESGALLVVASTTPAQCVGADWVPPPAQQPPSTLERHLERALAGFSADSNPLAAPSPVPSPARSTSAAADDDFQVDSEDDGCGDDLRSSHAVEGISASHGPFTLSSLPSPPRDSHHPIIAPLFVSPSLSRPAVSADLLGPRSPLPAAPVWAPNQMYSCLAAMTLHDQLLLFHFPQRPPSGPRSLGPPSCPLCALGSQAPTGVVAVVRLMRPPLAALLQLRAEGPHMLPSVLGLAPGMFGLLETQSAATLQQLQQRSQLVAAAKERKAKTATIAAPMVAVWCAPPPPQAGASAPTAAGDWVPQAMEGSIRLAGRKPAWWQKRVRAGSVPLCGAAWTRSGRSLPPRSQLILVLVGCLCGAGTGCSGSQVVLLAQDGRLHLLGLPALLDAALASSRLPSSFPSALFPPAPGPSAWAAGPSWVPWVAYDLGRLHPWGCHALGADPVTGTLALAGTLSGDQSAEPLGGPYGPLGGAAALSPTNRSAGLMPLLWWSPLLVRSGAASCTVSLWRPQAGSAGLEMCYSSVGLQPGSIVPAVLPRPGLWARRRVLAALSQARVAIRQVSLSPGSEYLALLTSAGAVHPFRLAVPPEAGALTPLAPLFPSPPMVGSVAPAPAPAPGSSPVSEGPVVGVAWWGRQPTLLGFIRASGVLTAAPPDDLTANVLGSPLLSTRPSASPACLLTSGWVFVSGKFARADARVERFQDAVLCEAPHTAHLIPRHRGGAAPPPCWCCAGAGAPADPCGCPFARCWPTGAPTENGGLLVAEGLLKRIDGGLAPAASAAPAGVGSAGSGASRHPLRHEVLLHHCRPTTPALLLRRRLARQEYGMALALATRYGLPTDIVYRAQWEAAPVTEHAISDYLRNVRSLPYVLAQCCSRPAATPEAQRALLAHGLRRTEASKPLLEAARAWRLAQQGEDHDQDHDGHDAEEIDRGLAEPLSASDVQHQAALLWVRRLLLLVLRRLECFDQLVATHEAPWNGVYTAEFFRGYARADLLELAGLLAARGRYQQLDILLRQHDRELGGSRLAILDRVPLDAEPARWAHLLPTLTAPQGASARPQGGLPPELTDDAEGYVLGPVRPRPGMPPEVGRTQAKIVNALARGAADWSEEALGSGPATGGPAWEWDLTVHELRAFLGAQGDPAALGALDHVLDALAAPTVAALEDEEPEEERPRPRAAARSLGQPQVATRADAIATAARWLLGRVLDTDEAFARRAETERAAALLGDTRPAPGCQVPTPATPARPTGPASIASPPHPAGIQGAGGASGADVSERIPVGAAREVSLGLVEALVRKGWHSAELLRSLLLDLQQLDRLRAAAGHDPVYLPLGLYLGLSERARVRLLLRTNPALCPAPAHGDALREALATAQWMALDAAHPAHEVPPSLAAQAQPTPPVAASPAAAAANPTAAMGSSTDGTLPASPTRRYERAFPPALAAEGTTRAAYAAHEHLRTEGRAFLGRCAARQQLRVTAAELRRLLLAASHTAPAGRTASEAAIPAAPSWAALALVSPARPRASLDVRRPSLEAHWWRTHVLSFPAASRVRLLHPVGQALAAAGPATAEEAGIGFGMEAPAEQPAPTAERVLFEAAAGGSLLLAAVVVEAARLNDLRLCAMVAALSRTSLPPGERLVEQEALLVKARAILCPLSLHSSCGGGGRVVLDALYGCPSASRRLGFVRPHILAHLPARFLGPAAASLHRPLPSAPTAPLAADGSAGSLGGASPAPQAPRSIFGRLFGRPGASSSCPFLMCPFLMCPFLMCPFLMCPFRGWGICCAAEMGGAYSPLGVSLDTALPEGPWLAAHGRAQAGRMGGLLRHMEAVERLAKYQRHPEGPGTPPEGCCSSCAVRAPSPSPSPSSTAVSGAQTSGAADANVAPASVRWLASWAQDALPQPPPAPPACLDQPPPVEVPMPCSGPDAALAGPAASSSLAAPASGDDGSGVSPATAPAPTTVPVPVPVPVPATATAAALSPREVLLSGSLVPSLEALAGLGDSAAACLEVAEQLALALSGCPCRGCGCPCKCHPARWFARTGWPQMHAGPMHAGAPGAGLLSPAQVALLEGAPPGAGDAAALESRGAGEGAAPWRDLWADLSWMAEQGLLRVGALPLALVLFRHCCVGGQPRMAKELARQCREWIAAREPALPLAQVHNGLGLCGLCCACWLFDRSPLPTEGSGQALAAHLGQVQECLALAHIHLSAGQGEAALGWVMELRAWVEALQFLCAQPALRPVLGETHPALTAPHVRVLCFRVPQLRRWLLGDGTAGLGAQRGLAALLGRIFTVVEAPHRQRGDLQALLGQLMPCRLGPLTPASFGTLGRFPYTGLAIPIPADPKSEQAGGPPILSFLDLCLADAALAAREWASASKVGPPAPRTSPLISHVRRPCGLGVTQPLEELVASGHPQVWPLALRFLEAAPLVLPPPAPAAGPLAAGPAADEAPLAPTDRPAAGPEALQGRELTRTLGEALVGRQTMPNLPVSHSWPSHSLRTGTQAAFVLERAADGGARALDGALTVWHRLRAGLLGLQCLEAAPTPGQHPVEALLAQWAAQGLGSAAPAEGCLRELLMGKAYLATPPTAASEGPAPAVPTVCWQAAHMVALALASCAPAPAPALPAAPQPHQDALAEEACAGPQDETAEWAAFWDALTRADPATCAAITVRHWRDVRTAPPPHIIAIPQWVSPFFSRLFGDLRALPCVRQPLRFAALWRGALPLCPAARLPLALGPDGTSPPTGPQPPRNGALADQAGALQALATKGLLTALAHALAPSPDAFAVLMGCLGPHMAPQGPGGPAGALYGRLLQAALRAARSGAGAKWAEPVGLLRDLCGPRVPAPVARALAPAPAEVPQADGEATLAQWCMLCRWADLLKRRADEVADLEKELEMPLDGWRWAGSLAYRCSLALETARAGARGGRERMGRLATARLAPALGREAQPCPGSSFGLLELMHLVHLVQSMAGAAPVDYTRPEALGLTPDDVAFLPAPLVALFATVRPSHTLRGHTPEMAPWCHGEQTLGPESEALWPWASPGAGWERFLEAVQALLAPPCRPLGERALLAALWPHGSKARHSWPPPLAARLACSRQPLVPRLTVTDCD